jgi:hypothetical protein
MTARLYTLHPVEGFQPKKFGGHRDVVIAAFFSDDEKTVGQAGTRVEDLASKITLRDQ